MSTDTEVKEQIRLLILAQQELYFTGGISPNSNLHKKFLKLQDQILGYFGLESRPLHHLMLFSYPFQPNHLLNTIAVETKAEWFYSDMVRKYFLGAYLATGYANDCFGCFSLLDKVEAIHWRLKKRVEFLKKKGSS